jgi:UDP-3-O-[3-hydroxymyristoyl] glucosamine N-acyltransferase
VGRPLGKIMLKEKYLLSSFLPAETKIDGKFINLENSNSEYKDSLVYCDNILHLKKSIENKNVSAILLTEELAKKHLVEKPHALVKSPRNSFYSIFNKIAVDVLHKKSFVGKIGKGSSIDPKAIVSNSAIIGDNCVISAGAIIGSRVEIKNNVTIGAGAVIGTDGILFFNENDERYHVKHLGNVIIEENVTILANATVVYGITPNNPTFVGRNTYIGIGSIIGHEAHIESNAIISGNCVIARRATVREGSFVGTNCMIREYIEVGKGAKVMAGSTVIENVPPQMDVSGNFAMPHLKRLREYQRNK